MSQYIQHGDGNLTARSGLPSPRSAARATQILSTEDSAALSSVRGGNADDCFEQIGIPVILVVASIAPTVLKGASVKLGRRAT